MGTVMHTDLLQSCAAQSQPASLSKDVKLKD